MNTINNILHNLNLNFNFTTYLTKTNTDTESSSSLSPPSKINHVNDSSTAYMRHKYDAKTPNPSLYQGYKFNQYQDKIINNTIAKIKNNGKEGFHGMSNSNASPNVDMTTSQVNIMDNVRKEYYSTLSEYNGLLNNISQSVSTNVNRIGSNNPYLNKYVTFTTGETCFINSSGVAKKIPNPTILKSISGKNNCPVFNKNDVMTINLPWLDRYNIPGQEIPTNPQLISGTEMSPNESCGYERSNVFVNSMINTASISPQYVGCFEDKKDDPAMTIVGDKGMMFDFNQCQQEAINKGTQYFALQNVDPSTGSGLCSVSNDKSMATKYGKAYKYIPLWSSNTKGQPVSYAIVSKNGTLSVCDQNSKEFFTTPNGTQCEQIYSTSANIDVPGNDLSYYSNQTIDSCKDICSKQSNCNGFVMDTATNTNCWTKSGEMNNIVSNNQRTTYKKTIDTVGCNYFLSLQNDGNMCIYKGMPNTSNITNVWSSNTNGQQREKNVNFVPEKSKYGMPFLKTDQILNKGDWISSMDGSLLLQMMDDGDLVLYTFESNCTKNNGGGTSANNYYGGELANPLYDLEQVGIQSNMGQLAFIDPNSQLHAYPASNTRFSDTYSRILENTKLIGNDIPGAMFSDSPDVESCMSACNKNENCSGFVYDTTGQTSTCIPKDNKPRGMYTPATGVNTYVRDKTFIELPHGIYNTVNNIDSIQYENYVKGNNNIDVNYGLTNISSVQKKQLQQLEDKLKQLSSQLNMYTNKLSENNNILDVTAKQNINKFNDSVTDFSEVKNKIKSFDTNNNIDNILNQVKINTLQKNYSYIFWCILAIVLLIIAIYISSYSSS
uniref:Apple domain-containing protein n=1 Tax=viral metagenome TaxID=1070528 RepID=A0A6C0DI41_9ZZZZ